MNKSNEIFYKNNNFRLYNNCLISNVAPHEVPNIKDLDELIKKNKALLARWTDKFDVLEENDSKQWWYLIKSGKWDILKCKSHDRNEIKKGIKNFDCKIIKFEEHNKSLYTIYSEATKEYSNLSSNQVTYEEFINDFKENEIIIGAFDKEDGVLSAYSKIFYYNNHDNKKCINLSVLKILPTKKRKSPSAALMDYICNKFLNEKKITYICDGERSIRHVTNFQKYLEKYFGFKKVFCRLNVRYSKKIKVIITILYPLRKVIKKLSMNNKKIYNLYVLLLQEEIVRSFKK